MVSEETSTYSPPLTSGSGVNRLNEHVDSRWDAGYQTVVEVETKYEDLDTRMVTMQSLMDALVSNFNNQFSMLKRRLGIQEEWQTNSAPIDPKERGIVGSPPTTIRVKDKGSDPDLKNVMPNQAVNSIIRYLIWISLNLVDMMCPGLKMQFVF